MAKAKSENRRYFGRELMTHCRDFSTLQFSSPFDQVGWLVGWLVGSSLDTLTLLVLSIHGK